MAMLTAESFILNIRTTSRRLITISVQLPGNLITDSIMTVICPVYIPYQSRLCQVLYIRRDIHKLNKSLVLLLFI